MPDCITMSRISTVSYSHVLVTRVRPPMSSNRIVMIAGGPGKPSNDSV